MKLLALAGGALALAIAASQPAAATSYGAHGSYNNPNIVHATYGHYRVPLPRVIYNLRQRGFYGFRNISWTSSYYKLTARGVRGNLVRIKVNAYSGRIVDIDVISYHGGGHHGGHGGWSNHGGHGSWGHHGGHRGGHHGGGHGWNWYR